MAKPPRKPTRSKNSLHKKPPTKKAAGKAGDPEFPHWAKKNFKKGPKPGKAGAKTGTRVGARPIEFPFDQGPIPEEYLDAVGDLALFCQEMELSLTEKAEEQLARYAQRLTEANTVMNLTRGTSNASEMASRHLGDCLIFKSCLETAGSQRVLDVGTGAGLPAIPLAIACPDVEVVALDTRAKKIAFVQAMKEELKLDNLTAIADRAETLAHVKGFRQSFDAVVSRATANLPLLLELTVPFLKPQGYLFASKGSKAQEEIEAASMAFRKLTCDLVSLETYPTMEDDMLFAMLVIQRVGRLDNQFPRHPSRIKSHPLTGVEV